MWGRRGGRVLSVTLSAGRPLAKGPERISFAPSGRAKEISIIWHSDADLHVLDAGVKVKAPKRIGYSPPRVVVAGPHVPGAGCIVLAYLVRRGQHGDTEARILCTPSLSPPSGPWLAMPPTMGTQCHNLLAGTTLGAVPGAAQVKQLEGPANWPCARCSPPPRTQHQQKLRLEADRPDSDARQGCSGTCRQGRALGS